MLLRIHHGAEQVGGNCIELEYDGVSLLLDLGLPLDRAPAIPAVRGLADREPGLLGVVLSHPHLDHYGLLPFVRSDLPVWLGEGAKRLLDAAAPFTRGAVFPQQVQTYRNRTPFMVGPFRITPYLMDHSAFDAYALLVEAGGKRLFYSGDFRGHGRKAQVFEDFLVAPPAAVDVLLMEGTSVGRDGDSASESDVEAQSAELMKASDGLVLLCFSGQNIDRFVTFLRASMRAGRTLVVDPYMAALVRGVAMKGLPDLASHGSIRIYLPKSQKRMVVRDRRFDLVEPYRSQRIFLDELDADPTRFSLMFRASMAAELASIDLAGARLIYSLWPGYLERDRTDLRQWTRERNMAFDVVHASGHASMDDLKRMAEAVQPKRLIPVHTERAEAYADLYDPLQIVKNGQWVDV